MQEECSTMGALAFVIACLSKESKERNVSSVKKEMYS